MEQPNSLQLQEYNSKLPNKNENRNSNAQVSDDSDEDNVEQFQKQLSSKKLSDNFFNVLEKLNESRYQKILLNNRNNSKLLILKEKKKNQERIESVMEKSRLFHTDGTKMVIPEPNDSMEEFAQPSEKKIIKKNNRIIFDDNDELSLNIDGNVDFDEKIVTIDYNEFKNENTAYEYDSILQCFRSVKKEDNGLERENVPLILKHSTVSFQTKNFYLVNKFNLILTKFIFHICSVFFENY